MPNLSFEPLQAGLRSPPDLFLLPRGDFEADALMPSTSSGRMFWIHAMLLLALCGMFEGSACACDFRRLGIIGIIMSAGDMVLLHACFGLNSQPWLCGVCAS